MVRSTSSARPISGSMRPSIARRLRLVAYFSSAELPSASRSPSPCGDSSLRASRSSPGFASPCEM